MISALSDQTRQVIAIFVVLCYVLSALCIVAVVWTLTTSYFRDRAERKEKQKRWRLAKIKIDKEFLAAYDRRDPNAHAIFEAEMKRIEHLR